MCMVLHEGLWFIALPTSVIRVILPPLIFFDLADILIAVVTGMCSVHTFLFIFL